MLQMKPLSPWVLGIPKQSFHLVTKSGNGDPAGQQTLQINPSKLLTQSVKDRYGGAACPLAV